MPYVDFSGGAMGSNKGSVSDLTNYLDKEDKLLMKEGKEKEFYFSYDDDALTKRQVDRSIDSGRGGLKKTDAKFYMITVNPSTKELEQMGNDAEKFKTWIRQEYMPQLAKDFNREGVKVEDLKLYGKIEYNRYYSGDEARYCNELNELRKAGIALKPATEELKKKGLKISGKQVSMKEAKKYWGVARELKSGDLKEGNNLHCHLILGRKTKDNEHMLSPNSNAKSQGLQGAAKNAGFNRNEHKIEVEQSWDKSFGFQRDISESFQVQQGLKQATTLEEKAGVLEKFSLQQQVMMKQMELVKDSGIQLERGMGM
ncbi:DUF5712 family protein [Flexithrix dorotheae]|uniref:DUF5712 family protein n=1 Tax=Flexithrix dorotheae TaxID=70993 RepID=UPI000382C615|nr:DUF5712 family protein [Flexithrix dorotheae]